MIDERSERARAAAVSENVLSPPVITAFSGVGVPFNPVIDWTPAAVVGAAMELTVVAFDQSLMAVGTSGEDATYWVAANPISGGSTFAGTPPAWAFSIPPPLADGGSPPVTKCAFDNPSGCNNGVTIVPPGSTSIGDWRGRPALAADRLGNVVYVALYDKDGDAEAEGLAAVVSHDGGRTFGQSSSDIVDINPSNDHGECDDGEQDMPHAAWDMTTKPPTLSVVWRHRGSGSFGGCIRSYRFNSSNVLTPITFAFSIDNMDRAGTNDGQGALKVRASDGVVTVVYQNADIPVACAQVDSVGWSSVVSLNLGRDWTNREEIAHTDNFTWCTLLEIQKGIGEFDFVIGPDGNEYAAVNDADDHISLFMTPTRGAPMGHGSGAQKKGAWRKFCGEDADTPWLEEGPNFSGTTLDCGSRPLFGTVGTTVFHPTLTTTTNSALALLFYEQGSTAGTVHPILFGDILPRVWGQSPSGLAMGLDDAGVFQTKAADAGGPIIAPDFARPASLPDGGPDPLYFGSNIGATARFKTEALCPNGAQHIVELAYVNQPAGGGTKMISHPDFTLTAP